MSQWAAILSMTGQHQEQVLSLYSDHSLPMEVRQYLAPWIESLDWRQAARDRSMADLMFQNFLEQLDTQCSRFTQENMILESLRFRTMKQNMQAMYQTNPQPLAEQIKDALSFERQILMEFQEVQSQTGPPTQVPIFSGRQFQIEQRVNKVTEKVQELDYSVKFLEDLQETFDFKYKNFNALSANHSEQYLTTKKNELQIQLNELDQKRKEVLDHMRELFVLCETLLGFIKEELDDWLVRQKLSCIGAPTNTCLKQLESWVTKLVDVFLQVHLLLQHLTALPNQITYDSDPLKTESPMLEKRLHELLFCLLERAFVVDKQPIMAFPCKRPLVLKTNQSSFSVRARFLVNLPKLKHSMKVSYAMDNNPPTDIKGYRRFNVLGPQPKAMEDFQGEGLVVDYKHLTLKEQKTGPGGKGGKGAGDGSLSILEELHVITFTTQFDYQGLKLNLVAATLPFVVISNISQFVGAWASILWFNLLSPNPKDLTFFSKPPSAPWVLLADALSQQFSCCTKRGLNPEQLQMLGKKLCGTAPTPDSTVSWSKFSKENVPRFSFTFWTWFDAILSLVKLHLENIWNDGYVMGFMSRSKEEELLKTKMDGTFLLRFSESIPEGGITCSWVEYQENGTYAIRSVEPYTKRELSHIPLTEIIRKYQLLADENIPENPLKYLYPDIPKDKAFGQYYEHSIEITDAYEKYLRRRLIIVSARQDEDCQSIFDPATPQTIDPDADLSSIIESLEIPDSSSFPDDLLHIHPGERSMDNAALQDPDLTRYLMNGNDPVMPAMQAENVEDLI